MFDLWLNESQKIAKEVIEESKLKQILKNKTNEFMKTERFEKYITELLENEIRKQIEEYAEYILCSDKEYECLYDQIQEIIANRN